jgi:hypothetical protein
MENFLRFKPSENNQHDKYGTFIFGKYKEMPYIKDIDGQAAD